MAMDAPNYALCALAHSRPAMAGDNLRPESELNWTSIEKNWRRFKVNAKSAAGKTLSEQQLDSIAGRRGVLAGRIQATCGMTREDTNGSSPTGKARQQDHE